ncbi:DoxX family protein [Massilia sp. TN1-12]|uniref:DoxX family protein n=1 Tax=Massilia paldalensis TaxID=3377675 RepID=UPI0038501D99
MSISAYGKPLWKSITWRGLLQWVLVAFFALAGLLNMLGTAALLAEYRRWGYPGWFHYVTGTLELSSALLQARRTTAKVGAALGAAVMAAAFLTLVFHREWLHAAFPLTVFFALIVSRTTIQP